MLVTEKRKGSGPTTGILEAGSTGAISVILSSFVIEEFISLNRYGELLMKTLTHNSSIIQHNNKIIKLVGKRASKTMQQYCIFPYLWA